MATVPTISPEDKRALWISLTQNVALKQFIQEIFDTEIERKNSLDGVTPENLQKRIGEVAGLRQARGIFDRKNHHE